MRKKCEVCGDEFEAKRKTARSCSARCRMRASRQPKPEPAAAAAPAGQMPEDPDYELATATLAELTAAGRAQSASGKAAMALARRIDAGAGETGASMASMVREHRAALADALKAAKRAATPLDELRARREHKLSAG